MSQTLNIPWRLIKFLIIKKEYNTTTTLPRVDRPTKASEQVKRGLVRETTKRRATLNIMLPPPCFTAEMMLLPNVAFCVQAKMVNF